MRKISRISSIESSATVAPRYELITTSASAPSCLMASRTGIGLTSNFAASSSTTRRAPG